MNGSPERACIVCGAGETGRAAAAELVDRGFRVTLVDRAAAALKAAAAEIPGAGLVEGDCLDDAVLRQAGLETAHSLFAVLPDDRSNVFLCLSSRRIRPDLNIYSVASDSAAAARLLKIGVQRTVNPHSAEGLRISNEMIRPSVAAFLTRVAYSPDDGEDSVRYLTVALPDHAPPSGTTLGGLRVTERTGVVVVAVGRSCGGMVYSPSAEVGIYPGDHLVAFGTEADAERVAALLERLGESPAGRAEPDPR